MRLLDQPPPQPGEEIRSSINVVSPGYFAVMGVQLARGAAARHRDGADAPRVVVVSEAFAERYLREHQSDRPAPRDPRAGKPVAGARSSAWCRRCGTSGSMRRRAPRS